MNALALKLAPPPPFDLGPYHDAGFKLCAIPPNCKGPNTVGWNRKEMALAVDAVLPDGHGVGLCHAWSGTMALDVDHYQKALVYFEERGIDLLQLFQKPDSVQIDSGNPGHGKLIYAMPFGLVLPSKKIVVDNVTLYELRCGTLDGLTVQDCIFPTVHPVTGKPYTWAGAGDWRKLPTIPDALMAHWLELIEKDSQRDIPAAGEGGAPNSYSWDEVVAALQSIDPDCDRDTWIACGMALHSAGHANAFDVWNSWSAKGTKYKPREMNSQWRSFKAGKGIGINVGTLFHHAKAAGWVRPAPDVTGMFGPVPEGQQSGAATPTPQLPSFAAPTLTEVDGMPLHPRMIVDQLIYADLRLRIAAGGTGKTTLALYEAMNAALGRPVWGRHTGSPVNTLIVSREDGRNILFARLSRMMQSMLLSDSEQREVLNRVRILDLSVIPFRLCTVRRDMVVPDTANINLLTASLEADGFKPDWIVFDPAVSFGVGESRVNDAEQGLVEAARILIRRFNCCVEFIHHTGKANAREKQLDQYAGRNGSAFADGARMVAVIHPLTPAEWLKQTGTPIGDWEGLVMALPKGSYGKPQEHVYVRRKGWAFVQQHIESKSPEEKLRVEMEKVLDFLRREKAEGRLYSTHNMEELRKSEAHPLNSVARANFRTTITMLEVDGKIRKEGHLWITTE